MYKNLNTLQTLKSKVHSFHLLLLIQLTIHLLIKAKKQNNNKIKKERLIMNLVILTNKLNIEVEAQIGCFLHLYRRKLS